MLVYQIKITDISLHLVFIDLYFFKHQLNAAPLNNHKSLRPKKCLTGSVCFIIHASNLIVIKYFEELQRQDDTMRIN